VKIDPWTHDKRSLYHLLTGIVVPRPIALVSSKNSNGTINIAPFSYFNIVSVKPTPRISLSIGKKRDLTLKDTAINIRTHQPFRIHVVDASIIYDMNETATNLPYGDSELAITNFSIDTLDPYGLRINEAKASFLCELEQIIPFEETDLYIAKFLDIYVDDALLTKDDLIDTKALKPVARLAKDDYSIIEETITIRRKVK
jgi:flavin reductase (DIM6/NTAB) family NADH-FMN oxidoreductase RutF